MQEFTFRNLSNQGLRIEVIRLGSVVGFLIGSGSTVSLDADSLHPNTVALIDSGYLIIVDGAEPTIVRDKPNIPLSYTGEWESGLYRKGNIVKHSGALWISLADQNGDTPAIGSNWLLFSNDDSNTSHILNHSNPHETTADQVGALPNNLLGVANGVPQLDQNGKISAAQLPSLTQEPAVFQAWSLRHRRNEDDMLGAETPSEITAYQIKSHVSDQNNPHQVTLEQLNGVPLDYLGQPLGVATLSANGTIPLQQLPASFKVSAVYVVSTIGERDQLAPSISVGSVVRTTSNRKTWLWTGSSFIDWSLPESSIHTINGATGQVVSLTTKDIPEHSSKPYFSNSRVANSPIAKQLASKSHERNRDSHLDISGPNRVSAHDIKSHLQSQANPHQVTAEQVGALPLRVLIKTVSGAYTVQKIDAGATIRISTGSVLLPSSGFQDGFQCSIVRIGSSPIVISAPGGNLQSRGNTLSEQYAACVVYYLGGGVWEAIGSLA